ncbi:putative ribonuclease H-like domain-containing protein [Tanacetum coccineum]
MVLSSSTRAVSARLSTFLLKHNYRRGTIDKTFFIKKNSRDIILVQVYVDDIIFGSTKKVWCDEFEVLMKGEFEMSAMGELTFFLGLQVKQKPDGIFINQDKYVQDMLKKFDMESVRTATTPYEASKPKSNDEPDDAVNVHLYRSMIGSLMYLTASRPDIMFAVSACSRHQVTPLTSNLNAVKKIFKYLKGQPKLGLWYPRDSPFVLEAYSDSDYAGSHGDRKSTTGGCQFLGRRLISWQCKKQTIVATSSTEAEYVAAANCCGQFWSTASLKAPELGPTAILATIDRTPYTITEDTVRSQLQLGDDGGIEDLPIADIYLELKAHKLLFKDVVGKLVKKVKALELKLKTRSRNVVMSESDKEEEEEQDVDPLIKLAKAATASDAHVDVSPGADIPPSPPLPTGMSAGVSSGVSTGTPAGTSNKGKSPIMEVDPPVKRRIFRQMEEDMLGQVHANQGFTSDLLGPDVNEDKFAERMVALIAERIRAFAAQRFQEKRNKPMTYA